MAEEGEKIWHYLLQSEDLQNSIVELIYTDDFDPSEFDWARVNETIADKVKTEFGLEGKRIPWTDKPVPDFRKEFLGELTSEEVHTIIFHLRWVDKFTTLMTHQLSVSTSSDAGQMADRLERLLRRVGQREGMHALVQGQCESVVSDKRCEGVKGHDGSCPQPFPK